MKTNTYIASKENLFFSDSFTYIPSNYGGNADLNINSKNNLFVPLQIFNNGLSGLEAISKYLKEVNKFRYCEIAKLLNRDDRTVWDAYRSATQKYSDNFNIEYSRFFVPISIFYNRSLSVLENLTAYLKEELNLRYCQIASLLNKDQRTIWTVYNRVKKKRKNVENS